MNERDFDNLAYLLQFSPSELQEWMKTQSRADQAYALEILSIAPYEVIDIAVSVMTSYYDAMEVIRPHMLNTEK
mgnify:FL=1